MAGARNWPQMAQMSPERKFGIGATLNTEKGKAIWVHPDHLWLMLMADHSARGSGPEQLGFEGPLAFGEVAAQVDGVVAIGRAALVAMVVLASRLSMRATMMASGVMGNLGGAELGLVVVGDDDVLEDEDGVFWGRRWPGWVRMTCWARSWSMMAPSTRWPMSSPRSVVGEGAVVDELAGLAQVVEEEAHHHDVAADLGVERADALGELEEREGVLEQAAEVGVVHALGGGAALEVVHEGLVVEVDLGEGLHAGVSEGIQEGADLGEHLVDIAGCDGEELDQLPRAWARRGRWSGVMSWSSPW